MDTARIKAEIVVGGVTVAETFVPAVVKATEPEGNHVPLTLDIADLTRRVKAGAQAFANAVDRPSRPELAGKVTVDQARRTLYIDGVEFPWHIAEHGVDTTDAGALEKLPFVSVPILAEDVEVIPAGD